MGVLPPVLVSGFPVPERANGPAAGAVVSQLTQAVPNNGHAIQSDAPRNYAHHGPVMEKLVSAKRTDEQSNDRELNDAEGDTIESVVA